MNGPEKQKPKRMCIVCKEFKEKSDLLRIVKNKDGEISIDLTGKSNGRGAYICNNEVCLAQCIKKKILNRVFKQEISEEIYKKIADK